MAHQGLLLVMMRRDELALRLSIQVRGFMVSDVKMTTEPP